MRTALKVASRAGIAEPALREALLLRGFPGEERLAALNSSARHREPQGLPRRSFPTARTSGSARNKKGAAEAAPFSIQSIEPDYRL
jgi:hypothetical protein